MDSIVEYYSIYSKPISGVQKVALSALFSMLAGHISENDLNMFTFGEARDLIVSLNKHWKDLNGR